MPDHLSNKLVDKDDTNIVTTQETPVWKTNTNQTLKLSNTSQRPMMELNKAKTVSYSSEPQTGNNYWEHFTF